MSRRRLTPEEVDNISESIQKTGLTVLEISKEIGCSQSLIYRLKDKQQDAINGKNLAALSIYFKGSIASEDKDGAISISLDPWDVVVLLSSMFEQLLMSSSEERKNIVAAYRRLQRQISRRPPKLSTES